MKYIVLLLIMLLRSVCCQDIITTIAGTGVGSYSGDGGAATSATLWFPYGVALDASGRILYYCLLHCYTVISAVIDNTLDNHELIFPGSI